MAKTGFQRVKTKNVAHPSTVHMVPAAKKAITFTSRPTIVLAFFSAKTRH